MDLWVKLDKFGRKKNILFVFKGYTCRFKSETFASIALRPCKGSHQVNNKTIRQFNKTLEVMTSTKRRGSIG